jgi:hypothetical protein
MPTSNDLPRRSLARSTIGPFGAVLLGRWLLPILQEAAFTLGGEQNP